MSWPTATNSSFHGEESAFRAEKNTPLVRAFLGAVRAHGGEPGFRRQDGHLRHERGRSGLAVPHRGLRPGRQRPGPHARRARGRSPSGAPGAAVIMADDPQSDLRHKTPGTSRTSAAEYGRPSQEWYNPTDAWPARGCVSSNPNPHDRRGGDVNDRRSPLALASAGNPPHIRPAAMAYRMGGGRRASWRRRDQGLSAGGRA